MNEALFVFVPNFWISQRRTSPRLKISSIKIKKYVNILGFFVRSKHDNDNEKNIESIGSEITMLKGTIG